MNSFTIQDDFIKNIDKKIAQKLDKKRYRHSIGVAYTACCMAMTHGADPNKAYLAGLLHDNAKCIETKEKFNLCHKYKLKINPWEKENPELLHAKLGACLAKEKFHIKDEEIISAIACHTTGKPEMSILDKIIYIADYIEPNRKPLENMDEIRKLAFKDLDDCLRLILKTTLDYLNTKESTIDTMTLETYHFYNN